MSIDCFDGAQRDLEAAHVTAVVDATAAAAAVASLPALCLFAATRLFPSLIVSSSGAPSGSLTHVPNVHHCPSYTTSLAISATDCPFLLIND